MIDWRLIIPLGLASATIAACVAYLMAPPWQVLATKPAPPVPTTLKEIIGLNENTRPETAEERALAEYEAAADAILKRAPNTRASTATNVPLPTASIPLPKRRPAP